MTSLAAGARLGPYEILAPLGAGGMGVVYRARDTKLLREVAVKVLPEDLAQSNDHLARFEREAKLLASLNHQNVAIVFGFEQEPGTKFLVMELVEGEDLASRLRRGRLPLREGLSLLLQVARGLEAAHENGVIHRDLKPSNIKVSNDGGVKILDFGLAKATPASGSSHSDLSSSPTEAATHTGAVMGTAGYMSPEQARGKPVDRRTDIWAFGCVLYEVLTGRRAFSGETPTDTLVAVLERDVDWAALPRNAPAGLRSLLRRCLQKDRDRRLHDIADARIEIEEMLLDALEGGSTTVPLEAMRRERRRTGYIAGGALFLATLIAAAGMWNGRLSGRESRDLVRFRMGVQPAQRLGGAMAYDRGPGALERPSRTDLALSPDGRHVVFGGGRDGEFQLYLRPLSEAEASAIPGTEGGSAPFFSPDGEWIGFWVGGSLRKVSIAGGLPVTICETGMSTPAFGASWGPQGAIAYGQERGSLLQVSAAGGTPAALTRLAEGEYAHRLPHFLPGGKALLFTVQKRFFSLRDAVVVSHSLETNERRVLVDPGVDARYVPPGHLVFARWGTLMAAPFDLERMEVTGGAIPFVDGVMHAMKGLDAYRFAGAAQYSVSGNGTLAYVEGGVRPDYQNQLVWVDRQGHAASIDMPTATYGYPRLSPDGRIVAVTTFELNEKIDYRVWGFDISRGSFSPLTHGGEEGAAAWTPDGRRIAFGGRQGLEIGIFWQSGDGTGTAEPLTESLGMRLQMPCSWTPDGQELAFLGWGQDADIWVLSLHDGKPRARAVVETPFWESQPAFSPDGRWLAFFSAESGRDEVYVQPYPGPGPRVQVSVAGGKQPLWSRDGSELFYKDLDPGLWRMMAVDTATDPSFSAGMPRKLFEGPYAEGPGCASYDVTPDGQRFVMVGVGELPAHAPVTRINIVLNWDEDLKRLVSTD